jgi:hypothetical protein
MTGSQGGTHCLSISLVAGRGAVIDGEDEEKMGK